jgi:hypothetical protein
VWKLSTLIFDIETAFLNGDLDDVEIFMDCPAGMDHEEGECLKLLKTIYGLVQSARQYFKKFATILKKIGFRQCPSDPCLFFLKNEHGIALLICYVDDCGLAYSSESVKEHVLKGIKEHGLNFTVMNTLDDYLSCEIVFNKAKDKAWVGQPHMIKKIAKTFDEEVEGMQKYGTPGTPGQGLTKPKEGDTLMESKMQSRYKSGVGMLLYLVKHSRPDIANAVRELTKCLVGASQAAYKEMLRVIKFVLDTRDYGLKLAPTRTKFKWKLVAYSDSDWAGDKDDRRSISGFILFLNGAPIMWRSKGQKTTALSSAEAEFVAAAEAIKEVTYVLQILLFLDIEVEMPVEVKVDNMGAIFMSENSTSNGRTRHMDVKWRYVNELCEEKLIVLKFVRSEDNYSDGKTKNVTREIYERHTPLFVGEKKYLEELD